MIVEDALAPATELEAIEAEIDAIVDDALQFAESSPWPEPDTATRFVFDEARQPTTRHCRTSSDAGKRRSRLAGYGSRRSPTCRPRSRPWPKKWPGSGDLRPGRRRRQAWRQFQDDDGAV